MNQNKTELLKNPSLIASKLGIMVFLLIIANIGVQLIKYLTGHRSFFGLVHLFDLNQENNLPAFFSSFLLLSSALLLFLITLHEKRVKASSVSKWAILSIIFLYMTADEFFSLHERLDHLSMRVIGERPHNIFYFSWVIPGIIIALIVAIFFLRFFFRLDAKTRLNFFIAATLYVGGAIGFELIGGNYLSSIHEENLIYSFLVTIEETLEMAGIIVFIWSLITYINKNFSAEEKLSYFQRFNTIITFMKILRIRNLKEKLSAYMIKIFLVNR